MSARKPRPGPQPQAAPQRTRPLSRSLQEFVEAAIADTEGLNHRQIEDIKTRLLPLYAHYRPNPPHIIDRLDTLGDTEQVRWQEIQFRELLKGYVTGFNNLDNIYYSLAGTYTAFVNEYIRIGRANYQPPDDIQTRTGTARLSQTSDTSPKDINTKLETPLGTNEPTVPQIGLFG